MPTLSKNGKPIGRPKGRKNDLTILKEAAEKKVSKIALDLAETEFPAIVKAMAKKAKGGDVQAAKLFFDRFWKVEGTGLAKAPTNILIHVESTDAQATKQRQINADGEDAAETLAIEVQPLSRGETQRGTSH